LKKRKKKPFNAMLGETYEFVSENFRMIGEKIQHNPDQITAFYIEGKGYKLWTYDKPGVNFRFGGGKGMVEIIPKGFNDMYLSKYDEHLTLEKGYLLAKNIIWGGLFVDSVGQNVMLNAKTGSKLVVDFYEKANDKENTKQHGYVYDKEGKARYEITGSYLEEYSIINLETGVKE
jgi:hypothetical protein